MSDHGAAKNTLDIENTQDVKTTSVTESTQFGQFTQPGPGTAENCTRRLISVSLADTSI